MTENTASAAPDTDRGAPRWLTGIVLGVSGLFYAYAVWNALGNLIQAAQLPTGLNALGWFIWVFATVFPILVFVAAFALGHRRPVGHFLLVMLTGLALVAVFWLNVVAYTALNTRSLLG